MIEYGPWYAGWGTLALVNAGLAQGKNRGGLVWFLIKLPSAPAPVIAQLPAAQAG